MPRCGCHGKPAQVVRRIVAVEIVEQQERIERRDFVEAERALEMHAGALDGRLALDDLADLPRRRSRSAAARPSLAAFHGMPLSGGFVMGRR